MMKSLKELTHRLSTGDEVSRHHKCRAKLYALFEEMSAKEQRFVKNHLKGANARVKAISVSLAPLLAHAK